MAHILTANEFDLQTWRFKANLYGLLDGNCDGSIDDKESIKRHCNLEYYLNNYNWLANIRHLLVLISFGYPILHCCLFLVELQKCIYATRWNSVGPDRLT